MAKSSSRSHNHVPNAAELNGISQAAFEAGGKIKAMVALISAPYKRADKAGRELIRNAFCYGDVAVRLGVTLEKGRAIVLLPGAGTKAVDRKTKAQEDAYAASRTAFKRFLQSAGLTTTKPKPKTARAPGGETSQNAPAASTKAEKTEQEVIAQAKTPGDARDYLRGQAAAMMAYQKKNAKIVPAAYALAVAAFKAALDAADKAADTASPAIPPAV
jgi:hypothetical protein